VNYRWEKTAAYSSIFVYVRWDRKKKWRKRKRREIWQNRNKYIKMTISVSVWWEICLEDKTFIIFTVPKNFGINSEFAPSPRKTISLLSGIHIQMRNNLPLKNTEVWNRHSRPKISKCVGVYPLCPAHLCCFCIGTGNTIFWSCGRLTYNCTTVCNYTDTQHVKFIVIIWAVVHFHTIKHN